MNLFNLDEAFDRHKINELFRQLKESPLTVDANTTSVIDELQYKVNQYTKTYHDLKYAMDQSTTITITDTNGTITYVDDHFCAMTGYTRQQLLGRNHRIFNAGFHEDSFFKNIWETIMAGDVWHGEVKNLTKRGHLFWVKTTIVPVVNENGTPYAFIAFRTDITQEKKTEERLLEAVKNDFRRTVNALVNLVFKVSYCHKRNDFYYTMFEGKLASDIGLTTDEVYGKTLKEVFGEEQAAYFNLKYEKAFQGSDIAYKHKYGNRYFYTTLSPISENGKIIEIIGSSVDITSHEEAELRMRHMAFHDPLTDLPNRRKLQEDIGHFIEQAESNGRPFAVMFCDLDRFKYVNDALGHTAGDRVITTMGERILEAISYQDELYRLSGDEYIIIIQDGSDLNQVREVGQKILRKVSKPIQLRGKEFFITASIGVSTFPYAGASGEELVTHADIAMHYCKMKGRNELLVYTPEMNRSYLDLVKLEGDLRRALQSNELELHYQPKVNVRTGKLDGVEALARWRHPEDGLISPAKFIPVAEETGLIVQLGEWVLREACRQNQTWINAGYEPIRIAVNISALELQREDFVYKIEKILNDTGMSPEYLELELTENSVMQNKDECIQRMREIRALGIQMSIDDFGTGYSSLGYLQKLPIHYIKIDQSFTRDVLVDKNAAEIVKAMIQLAQTFQLKVVAEGVEQQDILTFLKDYHCDIYQGYYFSHPVTAEDFEQGNFMKKILFRED